jgi:hypothetical protein
MSTPKNFKQILKNKPIFKPIVNKLPAFISRARTKEEEKKLKVLIKENTKILNKERCVVCESQLDGPIHSNSAQLYCVANNDHYVVNYSNMRIEYCQALYVFDMWEYQVIAAAISITEGIYNNYIYKCDRNLLKIFRYKADEKEKLLYYQGKMIIQFNKNITEKEFLEEMKLYITFS